MTTTYSPATSSSPRRARRHPLRAFAVATVAFASIAGLGALSAGPSTASALKWRRPPVSGTVLAPPTKTPVTVVL